MRSGGRGPRGVVALLGVALAACTIQERTDRAPRDDDGVPTSEFISPWGESEPPRAVRSGNLIWIWGMTGTVPGTPEPRLVSGGAAAEARQAIANIGGVLALAGAEIRDVGQCSLFVADGADLPVVLEVYAETFPTPPLRAAVSAGELAMGARVELECTAVVTDGA